MFSQLHATHCNKKVLLFVSFLAVSNSPAAVFLRKRNIQKSCKFIYLSHVIWCCEIQLFHSFIHQSPIGQKPITIGLTICKYSSVLNYRREKGAGAVKLHFSDFGGGKRKGLPNCIFFEIPTPIAFNNDSLPRL